uniref:5'-3' exoribonuclease 1 n=1 Tax=Dendroctonus ponderosae TaxID=77166 RepID=A0AAR5PUV6_DENPD
MGVPKFFRYISERYPCLSELVREYQIPEFDNMYLDMNGIIHMCSHPDDNNPHFRITEERIFQDVFHYIEVLFRMIRPQKLFFMAIDGVAPRAKMNQQRGRRFRAAKDAEKQEAEAQKKGETLPSEARFDSNCITPGTVFMARLHEQLKYFCVDKISTDPLWRDVQVILSGHETPGEGEHKIMDYIRYLRAQPGYNPNTRHCLYGLDADLIMLGLCTHEPHFSLLREEVKFGKKSTKRQSVPEEITFFLLHLSLMREYLELEFSPVRKQLKGFEYDFEKIIDDWVLMGFLVGNDFIPHLPNLHIANGALPLLYKAYMAVLPTLDGYINEAGTLNLARFEKFMQKLAEFDLENFEEVRDDLTYMEAKTGRKFNAHTKVSTVRQLEEWQADENEEAIELECLEPRAKPSRDPALDALIQATDDLDIDSSEDDSDDIDEDERAFRNYKKEYYMNKLEYANVTPEVLRSQAEGYVRAIQWNLHYYYNGCCSWSWYYPHHYAPYISDIKGFADLKLEFELGKPFRPFEQLLAVLPAASKALLPEVYHKLMTSEESSIGKYYPEDFQTDKNGKRQEWEAVVLIPFMDEKLLLQAMAPCNKELSEEERRRNSQGPMLACTYTAVDLGKYDAPLYFQTINHNHCKVKLVNIEDIRVPIDNLVKGAYPGASMDVYYPGFPTLKHLKYTAKLKKSRVKVFEQPSRYESMIIQVLQDEEKNQEEIPVELLGANVFVGWPHLVEGRIVSISNAKTRYVSMGTANQYNTEDQKDASMFRNESAGIIERYKNRLGIEVGEVKAMCQVQVMIGRKYELTPNGALTLEKQFSEFTANYPLQTIVSGIESYESHRTLFRNVQDVFPEGEICFTLGNPYYGAQGIVIDTKELAKIGRIKVCVVISDEPDFESVREIQNEVARSYRTLYNAASILGMAHFLYSRVTGSIFVETPDGEGGLKNINIGLDLKLNKKNKETPGYTRKLASTWLYTDKCTDLVREYAEKFPEVFAYLVSNASNENINVEHLFTGDDWDEKLKTLQIWLKNLPTASLEKQACGAETTDAKVVEEVEKIIDNFPKTANSKKITMSVKPSFLYKPELQSGTLAPDPKMQVEIFDRIVNTRKGFSVPFGLKGTVISIIKSSSKSERDTMYDVVFDKAFKDGMELNCSPGRGYRLPRTAFINISHGKRMYEQRIGRNGALADKSAKNQGTPWQNTNGQKFFNQFMNNSAQRHTDKTVPEKPGQGSAFAPFHHSSRNQLLEDQASKPSDRGNGISTERFEPREPHTAKEAKLAGKSERIRIFQRPKDDPHWQPDLIESRKTAPTTKSNATPETSCLNVSFEELAKHISSQPASIRLLTYYQSNGLGVPRYQFFQAGSKFKAQIALSNGLVVTSEPMSSKEKATESVASDVLQRLMKKGETSDAVLPIPPKTWVEPTKEKDQALMAALQNPFLPTQVIKRQTSRPSAGSLEGVGSKKTGAANVNENGHKTSSGHDETKPAPNSAQQRREKKSRIAANFLLKR